MPVDIRHSPHWNKASYMYSITDAKKIKSPFEYSAEKKADDKMTRLVYPLNPVKATQKSITQPFQSDTSVLGLCVLCYAVFPIFRFGLKLFYSI